MNIVVSHPKTGKAFNAKTNNPVYVGKKIGEEVDLGAIGLAGYRGTITGGSDKQGFAMKPGILGSQRTKVLLQKGIGFRSKNRGMKKKKTVAGNTIDVNTAQINVKVVQDGSTPFLEIAAQKGGEKTDEKVSTKERLIKESLEKAGSEELAYEKTKPKAKK